LLRLSRQRNDSAGIVLGYDASGRELMLGGRFVSSRSHLEEVLALYDPISHRSVVRHAGFYRHVNSQAMLGIVLVCLGFPDQALARSNAAIAEARRLAHAPSLANSLALSSMPLLLVGDNATLAKRVDQLLALATEQGFPQYRAVGTKPSRLDHGQEWRCGRRDITHAQRFDCLSRHRARDVGDLSFGPPRSACEIAGQIEEGLTLLDDALQIVEKTGERPLAAELHRHKGRLLLRQGHTDAAEELYCKALSIAAEQKRQALELRAAMSLARSAATRVAAAKRATYSPRSTPGSPKASIHPI